MSKVVFILPPAYGHLNPVLPVMQELIQRGEQVLAYNNEEFRTIIEATDATFRPYPPTGLSAAALSKALEEGNLAKPHALMMETAVALTPFMLDELAGADADLVVFDSLAIWGKIAATSLNIPAAATISHFVFDLRSMGLTFGELLKMMGQFLSQSPRLLAARRQLTGRYGQAYPHEQPLFPMRDRLNIVFTAREL